MNYTSPKLTVHGTVANLTGYLGDLGFGDALFINNVNVSDRTSSENGGNLQPEDSCFFTRDSFSTTFLRATGGQSEAACRGVLNQYDAGTLPN